MKNDPKDLFFKPVKVIIVFKKITNNLKDNTLLRCDNTNNILWKDPIIVELSINSTKPCHDLNKIGGQPKSIFGSSLLTTICLDKFVIETLRLNNKVLEDNKHLDKHYCTQKI